MKRIIKIGDEKRELIVTSLNADKVCFSMNGKDYSFYIKEQDKNSLKMNESDCVEAFHQEDDTFQIVVNESEFVASIDKKVEGQKKAAMSEGSLQSPMPGKIFKILKKAGDKVKKGDGILILEAMKMEHLIKAQKDGVIKEIFFEEGQQVQGGVALTEVE